MSDRDSFYLAHMLESIAAIESYCGASDLESDGRTLDAVLRRLQVLTESSKRISEEFKELHPDLQWRELTGFRNVLVHDYLTISLERVAQTVRRDLPRPKREVDRGSRVHQASGTLMRIRP